MLDWLLDWVLTLVQHHGLAGLLISSFLISTIFFPFSVEITFPVLIQAGIHKLSILLVATFGSLAGTLVNYYLGYKGMGLLNRYVKKEEMEKATTMMNKYGWIGLLAAISTPFLPVDPITILCGATKMNILEFTVAVLLGKLVKYAIVLGLIEIILHII